VLGELLWCWSDDGEVHDGTTEIRRQGITHFCLAGFGNRRPFITTYIHFLLLSKMIVRSFARCARTRARPLTKWGVHQQRPSRRYSTSSPTATPSPPASSFSMLGSVTSELDKISPRFAVDPSQIQILQSPGEFYDTLKVSLLFIATRYSILLLRCFLIQHEEDLYLSLII
jgi:hypothetical protein